jgi:hypothetical protein
MDSTNGERVADVMKKRSARGEDPRRQVANRPLYVAMGINLDGERGVLGMWVAPSGGRGRQVLDDLVERAPRQVDPQPIRPGPPYTTPRTQTAWRREQPSVALLRTARVALSSGPARR